MNREGLEGDVVSGSCLEQSDHEMLEFSIFGEGRGAAILDFGQQTAVFRTLVWRVPWKSVLKGRGVQEGWTLLTKKVKGTGADCPCVQ